VSDVLITRDGPYDAPFSYELAARESFQPTTVEGLVDGSGAGGSFKVVCVIRSPDGKVLARVPTSETFNPGDEVAVTFAPFLRTFGSAAAPATGLPVAYAATDAFSVAAGTVVFPDFLTFATNAPATFSHPGAHPSWIQAATGGAFVMYVVLNLVASPTSLTGQVAVNAAVQDAAGNTVFPIWAQPILIDDATVGDPKEVSFAQGFAIFNTDGFTNAPFHAIVDIFSVKLLAVNSIVVYMRQDSPTVLA